MPDSTPADPRFSILGDIAGAATLPGWVYGEPALHERLLAGPFAHAWQPLPPEAAAVERGHAVPFSVLPGSLDV